MLCDNTQDPDQVWQLVQELGKSLEGTVSAPHAGSEPPVWNELLKGQRDGAPASHILKCPIPSCYAHCKSAADVLACVKFAVKHRLQLCARGRGHHYAGACLAQGGMVVDMEAMQQITLDPATRTATIQPGVNTAQLRDATAPHGLHFPGGHISGVGCSGFILGGGNGWGVTQYGAAADNVLAFECVLPMPEAHGGCRIVEVTEASDPQLFRGLKGGGAFLAIVTAFRVALHPVRALLPTLTAIYPLSAVQQVMALHAELCACAPKCVEASVALIRDADAPDAPPRVILGCTSILPAQDVHTASVPSTEGRELEEGADVAVQVQAAYDRVRALLPGQRLVLQDQQLPYLKALSVLDPAWEWPGLCMYGHGMFVPHAAITPQLVQALADATEAMSSPRSLILLCPAAPVMDRTSSLCFRGGLFLSAYAMWARTPGGPVVDGDAGHAAWVRRVEAALGDAVIGLYMNETMWDQEGQLGRCYDAETLAALRATKARTDPLRLLRAL